MVDADVEFVIRSAAFGIGKESVGAELRSIGHRKQRGQTRRQRIDAARVDVCRLSAGGSDGDAAKSVGIAGVVLLRQTRVENLSDISIVAGAVERRLICGIATTIMRIWATSSTARLMWSSLRWTPSASSRSRPIPTAPNLAAVTATLARVQ